MLHSALLANPQLNLRIFRCGEIIAMTLSIVGDLPLTPAIVLNTDDFRLLTNLAHAGISEASTVADDLLVELDRANVVPPEQLPADVVRMGSRVRYRTGDGDEREVELVYPADADIDRTRISVMTPIGAALIGLAKGQSITWQTRAGRVQMLTVLKVGQ
jgi:regulator of nucleoside diphosphate kinase